MLSLVYPLFASDLPAGDIFHFLQNLVIFYGFGICDALNILLQGFNLVHSIPRNSLHLAFLVPLLPNFQLFLNHLLSLRTIFIDKRQLIDQFLIILLNFPRFELQFLPLPVNNLPFNLQTFDFLLNFGIPIPAIVELSTFAIDFLDLLLHPFNAVLSLFNELLNPPFAIGFQLFLPG